MAAAAVVVVVAVGEARRIVRLRGTILRRASSEKQRHKQKYAGAHFCFCRKPPPATATASGTGTASGTARRRFQQWFALSSIFFRIQRAVGVLCVSCAASAGAAYYAHWQQRSEKERMHQGVLRDMAREQALEAARALDDCEGGVCSLATKRIRPAAAPEVKRELI